MNRMTLSLLFVASLAAVRAVEAAERANLTVYAQNLDTIPVAIIPFKTAGATPPSRDLPWEVIADDLQFTGRFRILKAGKPDKELFAQNQVALYVDGQYAVEGNTLVIECLLYDAVSGDAVVDRKFLGPVADARTLAHGISNQIVQLLFGDRGVFESKVVFVRKEGINKNLFIMDYDGRGQRRLTNTNTLNIFPAFVDSATVIWTSFLRGKPDLYKAAVSDGTARVFLSSRSVQTSPAVSAVVGKIAYACSKTGNLEIYTCDLDGGNGRRITFTRAVNTSPCWSPNGYQLAFTSDRSGSPQIYIMDADGANVRRLTFNGTYQDSPAWSPRGERVAYTSQVDGKFDIWTIEPDGSHPLRLTANGGANVYPAWSPDGNYVMFTNTVGGNSDLCLVRSDGSALKRITNGGNSEMADWSRF